jgi:trehalose 6-phosphate phosphatase
MIQTPPNPSLDWCLFLDVDGTLVELTDTPYDGHASGDLKALLSGAAGKLHGALALVSGRSIDYLDTLFDPLHLPSAGLHGIERRDAAGVVHGAGVTDAALDAARLELTQFVRAHPGALLEDKGRTLGLHFRMAPQLQARAHAAIATALGAGYEVQAGNMMFEIKPRGFSKGRAIEAFVQEAPFAGRTPVFAGDDLTDLDGFRAVERLGGLSIGVGDRVQGLYHLEDPAAVRCWLSTL